MFKWKSIILYVYVLIFFSYFYLIHLNVFSIAAIVKCLSEILNGFRYTNYHWLSFVQHRIEIQFCVLFAHFYLSMDRKQKKEDCFVDLYAIPLFIPFTIFSEFSDPWICNADWFLTIFIHTIQNHCEMHE